MVAERRMRCPPTGARFGVQQVVGSLWRPRCPDACRGLVALSASSVSVHASGVRCPVSARAMSARPMSGCPGVRVSGCPGVGVSGVSIVRGVHCPGCPASVSARSASPSASVVSAPVTSWSASVDSHTARAMVWPPCRIRERLGQRPEPEPRPLRRRRPCWASGDVGWTWSSSWRRSGSGPGSIAWPARDRRLSRIARRSGSRYARCAPQAVTWRRTGRQGQGWRHEADHDLGWTAA
jgi:hypothetical protein